MGIRSRPLVSGDLLQTALPELKHRGKTVLVISHDDRYFHLADRMVVDKGASLRAYYQIKVRRTVIVDSQSIKTTEVAQEVVMTVEPWQQGSQAHILGLCSFGCCWRMSQDQLKA